MQNIAIIKQGTGRYLFSVPENVTLKEGDRVKCDTKRGIADGIAFADSAWVDENVSQLIGKLTGAKFPLQPVVGKLEYQPFENPADKPANKYEGMSNNQLKIEMCSRGLCHARDGWRRKHDCLFVGTSSCDVTAANRAEVIEYLLAEDAEADPNPQDKPTQEKQEPIKLYCVKDSIFGEADFTEGDVCTFNPSVGALELPDGSWLGYGVKPRSYDDWKADNPFHAACLVPLVKRPAKVGEWVLLDHGDCFRKNKQGDIVKVVDAPSNTTTFCFISDPTLEYIGGICVCFESNYSYVLDGYHPAPEPEPEPKYWSGKVVCVKTDGFFTVGKVYEFHDGIVKSDTGNLYNRDEPIKSLEELNDGTWNPEFIEFKGEAHD